LSKELEIEQLQSDLASSLRIEDVMRNEIQRVHDELSCITHKAKQLELQVASNPYSPTKQHFSLFFSAKNVIWTMCAPLIMCYYQPVQNRLAFNCSTQVTLLRV
jgi:hypothetical protein